MTAFHEVLRPLLEKRGHINHQTGKHRSSITNRKRWVSEGVQYAIGVWHLVLGNDADVGNWFDLYNINCVIRYMLLEAVKAGGRWKWRGFWLEKQ